MRYGSYAHYAAPFCPFAFRFHSHSSFRKNSSDTTTAGAFPSSSGGCTRMRRSTIPPLRRKRIEISVGDPVPSCPTPLTCGEVHVACATCVGAASASAPAPCADWLCGSASAAVSGSHAVRRRSVPPPLPGPKMTAPPVNVSSHSPPCLWVKQHKQGSADRYARYARDQTHNCQKARSSEALVVGAAIYMRG